VLCVSTTACTIKRFPADGVPERMEVSKGKEPEEISAGSCGRYLDGVNVGWNVYGLPVKSPQVLC
jgi:hypothetical protein